MMRSLASLGFILLSLNACAQGGGFPRPAINAFTLNETDRAEVVRQYGEPNRKTTVVVVNAGDARTELASVFGSAPSAGTYESLEYFYTDRSGTMLYGAVAPRKTLVIEFYNDKLVGYNFVSTFRDDSSNFNEAAISLLKKGKTTSTEVIQFLGPPSGRAGFPLVATMGEEVFIYQYYRDGRWRRESKRLDIIFSINGTVRDLQFNTETEPAPPRQGTSTVPIIIPRGK